MDNNNSVTNADFRSDEYKIKVVGVTYNNEDGTSRQKILQAIKAKEPPFNGNVHYSLFVYTYEGSPAVAVLANGMMIGNVPRGLVDFVVENIRNIETVSVSVYGGGIKKNGEKKSLGASATLKIDAKAAATQYNQPENNTTTYSSQPYSYSAPYNYSQPYPATNNTLTRNDCYLRAFLWCVCSCGVLFPVSIYHLYKSIHLPKKDSYTSQLSYEWTKMDCYIAAALWFILSFGLAFPVSIYYIMKSTKIEGDAQIDEIKATIQGIWEKIKWRFAFTENLYIPSLVN